MSIQKENSEGRGWVGGEDIRLPSRYIFMMSQKSVILINVYCLFRAVETEAGY